MIVRERSTPLLWRPPRWQAPSSDFSDPAEQALRLWAQRVQESLRSALPSTSRSQCTSPRSCSTEESSDWAGCETWHCTREGRDYWCAVDDPSERALLALIVGERNPSALSTLERQIVDELMCRVIGCNDRRIQREAIPPVGLWRCTVLGDRDERWTLQLLTPRRERTSKAAPGPIDLGAVPLTLDVLLPPASFALGDVLRWAAGDLCPLSCEGKELQAIVRLQGRHFASGTIGAVAEQRMLRVDALGRVQRPS